MGSQMPELGSKISVISKADIRYEGRLYQVDPQECTIGLANVRSFGTEDRETHYPVPAQNQIYEYILFRGSDIKDIRVINSTPIHQDPAIVQLVPPVMSQQPSFQTSAIGSSGGGGSGGTSVLGGTGSVVGNFGYGGIGLPGLQRSMIQPSELGSVSVPPSDPLDKDPELIGGVSRSTTPSLSRKSPTMDQSTQVTSPPRELRDREDNKRQPRPIQPPFRERFGGRRDQQQMYQPGQGFENNRSNFYDRRPNNRRDNYDNRNSQYQDNRNSQYPDNRNSQFPDNRNSQYPDNRNNQYHQNRQGQRPMHDGPRNDGQGWQQRQQRGTGRPRGSGPNRAGAPTPRKKNLLKFESEYDFDKANSEFEELRTKLTKLKVSGEAENVVEVEKKEDSGNETGAGELEPEDEVYYDKKKSFFDTISCEAVERSKGRSQRTDWRAERKLNTETFGVGSARRGMYRGGRGGYYGGQRNYGYRPRNNQQQTTGSSQEAVPPPPAPVSDSLLEKLAEKVLEESKKDSTEATKEEPQAVQPLVTIEIS